MSTLIYISAIRTLLDASNVAFAYRRINCRFTFSSCMHGKFWRPRLNPSMDMDMDMEVSDLRAMLLLYALLLWSFGQYIHLRNILPGVTSLEIEQLVFYKI